MIYLFTFFENFYNFKNFQRDKGISGLYFFNDKKIYSCRFKIVSGNTWEEETVHLFYCVQISRMISSETFWVSKGGPQD